MCIERCIEINASHFIVHREPSQAAFSLKHEPKRLRAEFRTSERRIGHASASSFHELCNIDRLLRRYSKCGVFARVSGNDGTTDGLHARRLAALQRAGPRCGQDCGLLAAKHSTTERTMPRGV
jgi:hypothetical protein